MTPFYSLHVAPKQDYLHSIHFCSFPFLYFKTSNQGYLGCVCFGVKPFQEMVLHLSACLVAHGK